MHRCQAQQLGSLGVAQMLLGGISRGDTPLWSFVQGCVVHKAWVRPNFKQGGSVRCIQLAPGADGRPGQQLRLGHRQSRLPDSPA